MNVCTSMRARCATGERGRERGRASTNAARAASDVILFARGRVLKAQF